MSDQARVWVNGALHRPDQGPISPFDHGLTVGDGVFETMKVVDGRAFALRRHLARLARSCEGLGLDPGLSDDDLRDAIDTTITAAPGPVGRVRVTVTGGVAPLGSGRGSAGPTVIVAVSPAEVRDGFPGIVTVPWPRNEFSAVAGLKTTSYAENVVALAFARERGADEAIFANTSGHLCEGTGSNVFVGVDGRLLTPPLASGCLAGVTRELVLESVDVEEVPVPMDVYRRADEVFLTSSTRDVLGVGRLDGRDLRPLPGPLTRAAAAAFATIAARSIDP